MKKNNRLLKLVSLCAMCLFSLASCSKKTSLPSSSDSSSAEKILPSYDMSGVSFPDVSAVYDGKEHKAEIQGTLPQGVTVTYENNTLTDAGEKEAIAHFHGDSDHQPIADRKAKLLVSKSDFAEVSFLDRTFVYDGKPHSLYVEGTVPSCVSVSYDVRNIVDAGSYTVTATLSDSAQNHNGKTMTAKLTIVKAELDLSGISFSDKTFAYDGLAHTIAIDGTLPLGVSVTYRGATQSIPGQFEATATFHGNDKNYNYCPSELKATITITNAATDFLYRIADGKVEITGMRQETWAVVIPERIESYPVTSIGEGAFTGNAMLECVTLPSTITSIQSNAFKGCSKLSSFSSGALEKIGAEAFFNCTKLKSFPIPEGVTSVGPSAFSGCTSLSSLTIPGSLSVIGQSVFSGCTSLASVDIPNGVTTICLFAFSGCTSLASLAIPDTVTKIEIMAFENCSSLLSVSLGKSVSELESGAFVSCRNLEDLFVNPLNPFLYSYLNCIIRKSDKTLVLGCKTSVIPEDGSVSAIGPFAFSGSTALSSLSLPDGIQSVGESAFSNCSSLSAIVIPEEVTVMGANAFDGCVLLQKVFGKATAKPATWDARFLGNCTASVYWYSETSNTDGSHWHYVGEDPIVWMD